jgi:hypothetical protein
VEPARNAAKAGDGVAMTTRRRGRDEVHPRRALRPVCPELEDLVLMLPEKVEIVRCVAEQRRAVL